MEAGSGPPPLHSMFELYMFFPLLEPAWKADPNKTAEVIATLMRHASDKNMTVTVSMLEQALHQLADGQSLNVIGYSGNELVEKFGPPPPAPHVDKPRPTGVPDAVAAVTAAMKTASKKKGRRRKKR